MSAVQALLDEFAGRTEPRTVDGVPFRLVCRLSRPASADEITRAWPNTLLPLEVQEFWLTARAADLFVDADYGQWGLRVLSPAASAARSRQERLRRPNEFATDDLVIGEFLGDQELLILDRDGRVMVALPLDLRQDWFRPAASLSDFLQRLLTTNGAKFWQRPRN